ncbi:glycoside hydrolase family 19 protein [Aestuariibaculum marinum]|uniref:Glycoside hydrolase family 19 protein n=1 Tax=Aestuariibaculum marinum TaxID=2683592 RepID=A0A8J6Q0N0_9FLAO|nr:glycoside hydrolase family 19 protein [Aestuariibaculum marinum]MBD0822663.1 glycoside hydrolase family 19 protein [Aestuariibaculum marinum]
MNLHNKYRTILDKAGINTPLRLAHFFAQLHHESNLQPVSENLNYSTDALLRVFGKYFHSTVHVAKYASKPEAIANRIYANRMGNGGEFSGDGWKYRGRGFIQITGKDNYTALSEATGVDYLTDPNKLLNEADSMVSAIWYWNKRGLNKYADRDEIKAITKRINGGYNGLEHRKALLAEYKAFFRV